MELSYDEMKKSITELKNAMQEKTGIPWVFAYDSTKGSYSLHKCRVSIGAYELEAGKQTGNVSYINYISMHKQCFHEYRHWQQYNEFFTGKSTGGLSEEIVQKMAVQAMIKDVFPNYANPNIALDNYLNLIMELDAEEHALVNSRKYFLHKGIPPEFALDFCMQQEVNRRQFWWGDTPIMSVDSAISDLHNKKLNHKHLVLKDIFLSDFPSPVYRSFMHDRQNMVRYLELPDDEQDSYLLDYICRHNGKAVDRYIAVLGDKFPELSAIDKVKQKTYMITHNMFDDNRVSSQKKESRDRELDAKFGEMMKGLEAADNDMQFE